MVEVTVSVVRFKEPYNIKLESRLEDLSLTETENHPYFKFKENHISVIRFDTEEEFREWFKNDYEELLEFEHWIEEDDKGINYISWYRSESLNCEIDMHIVR